MMNVALMRFNFTSHQNWKKEEKLMGGKKWPSLNIFYEKCNQWNQMIVLVLYIKVFIIHISDGWVKI